MLICCRKMPNTRSGASMTHEEVEELVTRRVAEEMEAREAARTLEPLNENGDEQEGENGGNGNGGNGNGGNGENGNGNRNGNHGMNYGGFMPVARECTFQDFLKCKPHNFSGTKGVVGLTRWFEKMETVFNISNCPSKYQVKYATCTLQDSALTWWNSHKRTIGVDAAYAMNWARLMRLMTEVYCPRNEIQKMETELWNLMQEDIQYAGSDTRPPMLDRTDFESWQQRIRLYCLGKDNGENIMKSIKEGPFQMGTVSDVITGGTEGAVQQGPVRARVLNDLSAEEKERYNQRTSTHSSINYTDAKDNLGKREDDSGSLS
ncbi:reverse transcriptase domain-containing protein [Tanacetum coccineum]|uniref:Reverse transcriptase domain-containing protein n=1 Tax=Tanacetum coccineum TaxID=301880 RepID=A0ABQ4YV79_9ASTR